MSEQTIGSLEVHNFDCQNCLKQDEQIFFLEERDRPESQEKRSWKILLVDDDPDVHQVTKFALHDLEFKGKSLHFINAYSAKEAKKMIENNPDAALIFLDIMMETEHSGLEVVKYIREVLKNERVRIILRTGQPGQIPEDIISLQYDINGYRTKTELTRDKLIANVVTSLRGFDTLVKMEESRAQLQKTVLENRYLYEKLEEHAKTLKNKVTERTKELEQKNKHLECEIQERKRIERELQVANQKLTQLATLDSLTEVANRRRFDEYLEQEWDCLAKVSQPCSLILYDVDYFKLYNDTYGHQAGDACLKEIAKVLVSVVTRSRDLVARYGGEEFAIVLPNTESDRAWEIARGIQLALDKMKLPHRQSKVSHYVTASLGIATKIPTTQSSTKTLIRAADLALYEAKREGRNRICTNDYLAE